MAEKIYTSTQVKFIGKEGNWRYFSVLCESPQRKHRKIDRKFN